jgi:hypothetical protein
VSWVKITKLPNGGELHECFGNKWWYLNGSFHREDGHALEWFNGNKEWWINGELLHCKTQKQFERLMRLKAFW